MSNFTGYLKASSLNITGSPVMLPYATLIKINQESKDPVFRQIATQIARLIKSGTLSLEQRIVSSRELAKLINVHRKTVLRAYDELISEGWIEMKSKSGTYVSASIPENRFVQLSESVTKKSDAAGFYFKPNPPIEHAAIHSSSLKLHLDDGFPDARLAPLNELARAYRRTLMLGNGYARLGYGDPRGSTILRKHLAKYLNDTRGLRINENNIIIVRGTMMAYYLVNMTFIEPGDNVVMGDLHWASARMISLNARANIISVPADINGMEIDKLEQLCRKKKIRMVYVTPHHDYPTTVKLNAERRLLLQRLAEKYRFIIFEDDYDFDFHYDGKPLLPLASADPHGLVLYAGAFTKSISPAFRVGYIVGPEQAVQQMSYHRRIIDRQGDLMLENALAELLEAGVLERHLKKSVKQYRERRDFFCGLLEDKLNGMIAFQLPEGGLSAWVHFDQTIDLLRVAEYAKKNGLFFSNGSQNKPLNATRFGFASSNLQELEESVEVLKRSIMYMRGR